MCCALAMVAARLSGNRLLARFRPDRLLPVLALVATVGFTTALMLDRPLAAIVGFGCLGLGLASVVPAVFSAAGRLPGLHPGTAVATVSAFGWAAFVALGSWFAHGLKNPQRQNNRPLRAASTP